MSVIKKYITNILFKSNVPKKSSKIFFLNNSNDTLKFAILSIFLDILHELFIKIQLNQYWFNKESTSIKVLFSFMILLDTEFPKPKKSKID